MIAHIFVCLLTWITTGPVKHPTISASILPTLYRPDIAVYNLQGASIAMLEMTFPIGSISIIFNQRAIGNNPRLNISRI